MGRLLDIQTRHELVLSAGPACRLRKSHTFRGSNPDITFANSVNIPLGITTVHAKCVKFQNLSRQVLGECCLFPPKAGAKASSAGISAHADIAIVQIGDRGRMSAYRFKHISKFTEYMWPDCLPLIGRNSGTNTPFGSGHREMIGPRSAPCVQQMADRT